MSEKSSASSENPAKGKPEKGKSEKGKKDEAPPPPPKVKKPYEVIQAYFNGNEVKIKMPKSLAKPPVLTPSQQKLQQLCTCDDDESVCSDECGKGAANPDANKLNFQIPDDMCEAFTKRTRLNSELVYSKKVHHDVLCSTCGKDNAGAHKKDAGDLDVHKTIKGHKDVYLLRLGKQSDEPARKGNIQVELKTPRALARPVPPYHCCQEVQCDGEDLPCIFLCRACKPIPKKKKSNRKRSCCG